MNLSQPPKVSDRSLSSCSCNQNDDPSQIPDMTTTNKLITTVCGLNDDNLNIKIAILLKLNIYAVVELEETWGTEYLFFFFNCVNVPLLIFHNGTG